MRFRTVKTGSAVNDKERIPLSRLSHAGYCLRRAALLSNEQLWQENADTAKGRAEHERVHMSRTEHRGRELKLYEYAVFSQELGIGGMCDCVEAEESPAGCQIPSAKFPVSLYPVEFKHGKLRTEEEYEIQLCAQAMCLEEMYKTTIPEGAIFYISSHRRKPVKLDTALRKKVLRTIEAVREIQNSRRIPPAESGQKCRRCSLREQCMPDLPTSAAGYCAKLEREAKEVEPL